MEDAKRPLLENDPGAPAPPSVPPPPLADERGHKFWRFWRKTSDYVDCPRIDAGVPRSGTMPEYDCNWRTEPAPPYTKRLVAHITDHTGKMEIEHSEPESGLMGDGTWMLPDRETLVKHGVDDATRERVTNANGMLRYYRYKARFSPERNRRQYAPPRATGTLEDYIAEAYTVARRLDFDIQSNDPPPTDFCVFHRQCTFLAGLLKYSTHEYAGKRLVLCQEFEDAPHDRTVSRREMFEFFGHTLPCLVRAMPFAVDVVMDNSRGYNEYQIALLNIVGKPEFSPFKNHTERVWEPENGGRWKTIEAKDIPVEHWVLLLNGYQEKRDANGGVDPETTPWRFRQLDIPHVHCCAAPRNKPS